MQHKKKPKPAEVTSLITIERRHIEDALPSFVACSGVPWVLNSFVGPEGELCPAMHMAKQVAEETGTDATTLVVKPWNLDVMTVWRQELRSYMNVILNACYQADRPGRFHNYELSEGHNGEHVHEAMLRGFDRLMKEHAKERT